jgi:hypothetical protein
MDAPPGAILAGGAVAATDLTASLTGTGLSQYNVFNVSFSVPDIQLGAGRYWLNLYTPTENRPYDNQGWGTTGAGSGDAFAGLGGPLPGGPGQIIPVNTELSFSVNGTAVAAPLPPSVFAAGALLGLLAVRELSKRREGRPD